MIYFKQAKGAIDVEDLFKKGFAEGYFHKTYTDPECTSEQCHFARRSFKDLVEIAQTYFPETTEEQVANALVDKYKCFFCGGIKKWVFFNHGEPGHHPYVSFYANEDHKDLTGISYTEIVALSKGKKALISDDLGKGIYCYNLDQTERIGFFKSKLAAAEFFGVSAGTISNAIYKKNTSLNKEYIFSNESINSLNK